MTGSPVQTQTPQTTGSAEYPFDFKAYGVFSQMITQRNYRPAVVLKDATDGRATDAVGAVSGLRGEISMIEGRLIVSYGIDCGAACPAAISETATLLATASAQRWQAIAIDKDPDAKATEAFIRAQAKASGLDENKPFPFRINGAITDFVMHVNAAPNPRFKGHGSFDEMAVTGLAKGRGSPAPWSVSMRRLGCRVSSPMAVISSTRITSTNNAPRPRILTVSALPQGRG